MASSLIEFSQDDEGYFAWLMSHSSGFVLNVRTHPDSNYVVLHRASCGSISSRKLADGAYTSRNFRKWCADSLVDLATAAKKEGKRDGSFSKRCGMCKP